MMAIMSNSRSCCVGCPLFKRHGGPKGDSKSQAMRMRVLALMACLAVPVLAFGQDNAKSVEPLARVLQPYVKRHAIAGAVALIANRDRVLDREAVGYSDISRRQLMEPNNEFWIASMGKAMTAAAVMMLADEGKVHLDDPVEKYLPEFKGQKVQMTNAAGKEIAGRFEAANHPITIREILSHTAGLRFSSKEEPGALDQLPLKDSVAGYAAEPLLSQPGTQYSYSNEGFNTAGRIVEVVSGMPLARFLQVRLFDPLGMTHTTFWPAGAELQRLATSYESKRGNLKEVPISQLTYPLDDRQHRFAFPAGGLFSTADDIAHFCQMMLNGGVYGGRHYLSERAIEKITTKETGPQVSKSYGLGWTVGNGFYEHGGAYRTDMKVDMKDGLVIVFLTQRSNSWKHGEAGRIMDALEQAGVAMQSGPMLSPRGTPTEPEISAQLQSEIDDDIARHLGDVPVNPGPKANLSGEVKPAAVQAAMRKVADWELARSQAFFTQNWTWSILYTGFMASARELQDSRYSQAMEQMADKFQWQLGAEDPVGRGWPDNNDQALGQTYLELYSLAPAAKKIEPTRKALDTALQTVYPPAPPDQSPITWSWCDTLFMGPPTWSHMAAITHQTRYLDYLDKRWRETSGALYDTHYHLFYRDKSFMGLKNPAGQPVFWSRGNGWVMGGLARTLEYMPSDYPDRGRYVQQIQEMAAEMASLQDPQSGLWHSDLLDAVDYPQPEVSGSSLILLGLAWGVNHGVLDRDVYTPVVERAWRGLVEQIYADGRLGNVQQTGGSPEHYMPASSYNFGVGAFLLAGEQVAHLAQNEAR